MVADSIAYAYLAHEVSNELHRVIDILAPAFLAHEVIN